MQHSHESADGNVGKELLSLETIIAGLDRAGKEAPSRFPNIAKELRKRNSGWNSSKLHDRLKAFSTCIEVSSMMRFNNVKVTDLHRSYVLQCISKPKLNHYQKFYWFFTKGPAGKLDQQSAEQSILNYLCDKPRGGQKISLQVRELVFSTYAMENKFNYVQIAEIVNDFLSRELNEKGNEFFDEYQIQDSENIRNEIIAKRFVSVSSAKRLLYKNKSIMADLKLKRDGESAWSNDLTPLRRIPAHNPLDRVELDASVISIPYRDHLEGVRGGLTVCIAVDTCTGAIIGYSIATDGNAQKRGSENAALYLQTIGGMVSYLFSLTGSYIVPAEIFTDRFPGHNSDSIEKLKEKLKELGCHFHFDRTGKGRVKGKVETTFRQLTIEEFKHHLNFIGGNITTKSRDSRKSPEAIAKILKTRNLQSKEQVEAVIVKYLFQHNERIAKGQKVTRLKRFQDLNKPNARPMLHETYLWMFCQSKIVTVRQGLIRFQIKGKEYIYELPDKLKPALNGRVVDIRYTNRDVKEGEAIWVFEHRTEVLITECSPQERPNLAEVNQTENDRNIFASRVLLNKSKRKAARETLLALEASSIKIANHLNTSKVNTETIEDLYLFSRMSGVNMSLGGENGKKLYVGEGKIFQKSEAGVVKELEPIIIDRLDVGMSQSDHNEDDDTGYMTISR